MSVGQSPIVSVVIPAFNRRSVIRRAVTSALSQTYDNLEVIVVDDASTDGTLEEIADLSGSRLIVIPLKSNVGGAKARNVGVKAAKGALIAYLDSDDYWQPVKISEQLKLVPEDLDDFLIYNKVLSIVDGKDVYYPEYAFDAGRDDIFDYLIHEKNFIQTSGVMMPKRTAERFSFDETLRRHQDLDLVVRLVDAHIPLIYCNSDTVFWSVDHNDKTRVSVGTSAQPTIDWLARYRSRLGRKSLAEVWGIYIAPKLLDERPMAAIAYFVAASLRDPTIAVRALKKIARRVGNRRRVS
jgi:glycosyltransferase involved in cell wall biosynthesis